MYKIQKYRVVPALPDELGFLRDLAYNLYWTWDHDSKSLFHRLDTRLAEKAGHNPVLLLGNTNQNRLVALAKDDGYLSHLARVRESLDAYMNRKTWFEKNHPEMASCKIAYFSMEYGLAKGMPIYSGGLGILAADHLKSASDLGLPLVAIGLLYQHGYFDQYLARDGWQKETYPKNDFYNMPIVLVRDDKGKPKTISLDYPDRTVYAQIWRAQVGRIPLYLLDSNVPENSPEDKKITTQLYGGDEDMRIKQELLLGIGGIRLLDILGERPHVCHMNEGHSAFLALERISLLMKDDGLSFADAWEAARGSQIFTSHTPVPAGIDEFDVNVIDRYIGPYYDSLKITKKQFCELGGTHYRQTNGKFNMAIFAINMAGICNGVSELHGKVSRKMWNYLWPEMPEHEVLIGHITNGIHTKTWISQDIAELFL
jgi:starch phosphorylase